MNMNLKCLYLFHASTVPEATIGSATREVHGAATSPRHDGSLQACPVGVSALTLGLWRGLI